MINVSHDKELANLLDNVTSIIHAKCKPNPPLYFFQLGSLCLSDSYSGSLVELMLSHPDFNLKWYYVRGKSWKIENMIIWLERGDIQAIKEILMFTYLSESF